ncbi:helix-turn-helix transcriptional regulator [Breoghania sp.]|uniref:helix-turn-helix domain-containing protein n=1 Tax=Breoghania sp. TaxID=2065378 RepID=UPI002AA72EB6|nr:helix-turn-helix transcriptional regulator [Breoghania sp.]
MAYESEHIAAALKEARESKGLSQRELAKRSGVPQSHISKIESNAVDLRISSLAALAHALDLELALIPRKATPAVKSIIRSTASHTPQASVEALRELNRAQRALERLPKELRDSSATQRLQTQLAEMNNLRNLVRQTDAISRIRSALETIDKAGGVRALEKAAKDAQRVRNILAHNVPHHALPSSRPAYSLDDDEEDSDA